ncbi:MAG: response regulator [Chloroflexi bacterium]|nr:response regulator [Chloroflexota bacterium]MCI0725531.1 response regulator [Chloroflexota bacterium]
MKDAAVILLVEDDQSLLDGISDLLEVADIGYDVTVLTASNGKVGLEMMAERMPDLIISDIMMPHMDGFQLLQHVRQNPAWLHIPMIFLSARGTKRDILEGRLIGAELYITKPFDNDELLDLVKSQLDRAFELQQDRRRRLDSLQRSIIQLLNHEFRTPLTYVTAYYEMLAESLQNENIGNLQEYLRGIQVGAVRLTRLVEDFIAVIEIRTGEARLHFEQRARPIEDLSLLVQEVGRAWRQARPECDVECRVPAALPAIYGDRESLVNILDRLMDNGVKFSQSKRNHQPHIELVAEGRNGEVWISVKDNGVGFPMHARQQLFELFYQHNRAEMEQQGSGSGLTIVKGLVEIHDGRIEIESEEDVGSAFTVVLPVYKPGWGQGIAAGGRTARKQATVLLVEDEWYLLEGLRELLEIYDGEYELHVITAGDGLEGLAMLARHQPDLIISDIMMPRLDGYDFLAEVRQNPAWLQIPFIFLTAKGERQDEVRGRRSGAEEYITKPYDSDELLHLVNLQLSRHFQRQGIMYQNFEELKRGILELLRPDFRLPLTSVASYSQKLSADLEKAQTDEDLKDSLRGIQASSSRLTRLVEDFIFLAEMRAGEVISSFELRAQPTDPAAVLLDVAVASQGRAERANARVEVQLPQGSPLVLMDYERLRKCLVRVVETLLTLCSENSPSTIYLGLEQVDDMASLSARCEGLGFAPEAAGRMNELFALPELSPSLDVSGFDPALVIVKGIVDLHGGQVRLENNSASGCELVIRLPLYRPEPAAG